MIEVPHLEENITHNCNLSCRGCMHFTSHGHDWFVNIGELEKYKIECAMLPMRHQRTLGGGFHCITLDLERN